MDDAEGAGDGKGGEGGDGTAGMTADAASAASHMLMTAGLRSGGGLRAAHIGRRLQAGVRGLAPVGGRGARRHQRWRRRRL